MYLKNKISKIGPKLNKYQGIFCSVSFSEKPCNFGHLLINFEIWLAKYLYINDKDEVGVRDSTKKAIINNSQTKFSLNMRNFHPLEVVGRGSETQLEVDEN